MGILSFLGKQQEPDKDPQQKRKTSFRRYGSSVIDRLTQDFKGSMLTANGEIEASLRVMRGRSRQLAMDNDYASKFLKMVKNAMRLAYSALPLKIFQTGKNYPVGQGLLQDDVEQKKRADQPCEYHSLTHQTAIYAFQ